MIGKKILAWGLALTAGMLCAAEAVWNTPETLALWSAAKNVRYEIVGKHARLSGIGVDCAIVIRDIAIDPAQYDTLIYQYRATGTGNKGGQLYFAGADEKFSDAKSWRLPRPVADGRWHTVKLPAGRLADQEKWFKGGIVTQLRFDPTDSAGGEIELAEIRFGKAGTENSGTAAAPAKPAAPPSAPSAPGTVCWNKQNQFHGWRAGDNLTCENQGETLKLTLNKADGRIINAAVDFDPSQYTVLVYRYRATGVGGQGGQMYFAKNGKSFAANDYWMLPRLNGDGKWHTVKVSANRLANADGWFRGGNVTQLRFDPTDSAGGEVEIAEIRFERGNPAGAAMTPKLDVPPWPPVRAHFVPDAPIAVKGAYFQGKMIYEAHDFDLVRGTAPRDRSGTKYSDFFLRRTVELKAAPERAFLQFVADDSARVYLNGREAGSVASWSEPVVIDVREFLHQGANILAFHYRNGGNAGGVLAELFVGYADGSWERFNTDETFVGTVTPPDNWNLADANLAGFAPAIAHAPPPAAPWLRKLAYRNYTAPQKLLKSEILPRAATGGETVKMRFELEGGIPACPFYGTVRLAHGRNLLWEEDVLLTEKTVGKLDGRRWQIELDYRLPLYMNSAAATLELDCSELLLADGRRMSGPLDLKRADTIPGWETPPVCQVKTSSYGPYFELNGKPFYHVGASMPTFVLPDPPTNVVTVGPMWYDWWTPEGELVFEAFDRAAEAARRTKGDSCFVWNLSLYVPRAWLKQHPDEICKDDRGAIVRDGYPSKRDSHSFASAPALAEMRSALLKALAYLENSPYANRIIGYRINGGHTIEWLGWSPPAGRALDFSPAAQTRFAEFAGQHYPELRDATVPSVEEREARDGEELVWDPSRHLKAIAYNEFYSTMVADTIIDLCSSAKKFLNNRKLVGTYYGYTMTLNCNGVSQMRSHYALKKLLNASCVDFLMSPQPYNVRNFGDTYGDMKPFASMKHHAVVPLHEDDTRTHKGKGGVGFYQAPNAELCTEILRRNMGFNLCRNMPNLFIALPGNYEFPEARRDFKTMKTVGQHCLDKQVGRHAEIALVVSEKSILQSPAKATMIKTGGRRQIYRPDGGVASGDQFGAAFAFDSFGDNYNTYAQLGAPADYLLAEDLADHPGDYKLYVFVNCAWYDEKFLAAVEKLRGKNCTLLWMYAPGYTFGGRNSVENMKRLTGLDFVKLAEPMLPAVKMADGRWVGSPTARLTPFFAVTTPGAEVLGRYENGAAGLARMRVGNAETVFCGVWRPDLALLREVAARAGITIYSASGDPLEANDALIAMHVRKAGDKTVKLPRKTDVLDVFNRKIIARNADTFTFPAKLHESPLFYCGDDAEALLRKLEGRK